MVAAQPASANIQDLAARLWETADELRANSHLKAAEYSIPVLGLIFLKFADSRFTALEAGLRGKATGRREIGKTDYQARGVLYLPEPARFMATDAGEPRSVAAVVAAVGAIWNPQRAKLTDL